MRLYPLILVLLAFAAAAQTPSKPAQQEKPPAGFAAPIYPEEFLKLPPDARLSVEVDGVLRTVSPPELRKLMQQGKKIGPVTPGSTPPAPPTPACHVDHSKIDAEKKASDEHLRQMKRRNEIVTVQDQFEQEMYYEDRYEKLREKTCGKNPPPNYGSSYKPPPDMRKKACAALGGCKPVKHW